MNNSQRSHGMQYAQSLAQAGHIAAAEAAYREVIAADPQYHPAYQALGLLAYDAGNLPFAAEMFFKAITLDKNVAIYYRNYCEISRRLGRFAEALEAGKQACRLAPGDISAHFNLGLICSDLKDAAGARDAYSRVLELQEAPLRAGKGTADIWHVRGMALHRMERFEEARQCYECSLNLRPDFPEVLNALGSLFKETGKLHEAYDLFSKAIVLSPDAADIRLNLGMVQVQLGDWENGWQNYEARWHGSAEGKSGTFTRPTCPLPQWEGQGNTASQALLVFGEQGFGDLFQFSRYIELTLSRFAKVGLVCPISSTHTLMERTFGDRVVFLKEMPLDFATWDWQCPLMSLPHAFKTRIKTVPRNIPYLHVTAIAKAHWRARLEQAAPGRFRIGVAWQGRASHQYDGRRSLAFEQLLPLFEDKRITWVSLQKREQAPRPTIPRKLSWIDWSDDLIDFSDTAGLISNLDLVISIDSAMVHLAGALGRPVWMLNRFDSEWRWLARSEDSPWYPSLCIFNQPRFGDWDSVIKAVREALPALIPNANPAPVLTQVPEIATAKVTTKATTASTTGRSTTRANTGSTGLAKQPSDQELETLAMLFAQSQYAEAKNLAEDLTQRFPKHGIGWKALGAVLGLMGQRDAALAASQKAANFLPDDAEAHHNLGIAQREANHLQQAVASYKRALRLRPNYAEAHHNLGITLRALGQAAQAEENYVKALQLKPEFAEVNYNFGNLLLEQERLEEAEATYRRALQIKPNYAEVHNNLGIVLRSQDRPEEAEVCYRRALQIYPHYAEAHYNLGIILTLQERLEEAQACNEQALQGNPNYAEAHNNLGIILGKLKRFDEAEARYRQALQLNAGYVEAHYNLGNTLLELERREEAEASLREALRLKPDYVEAHNNLGIVLKEGGLLTEAEACYRQALQCDADSTEAHNNLGIVLGEMGRLEESEASLLRTLQISPTYPQGHYNLGLTLLTGGRLREAWPKYEYRWEGGSPKQDRPASTLPQWTGQTLLKQECLLIFGEQGMGDKLQFARYFPLVAERFATRVSAIVDQPLLDLFRRSFPQIDFLPGVPADQQVWQYHCPMLSLPLAFDTALDTIPNTSPYLRHDADKAAHWKTRIDALAIPASTRKIGIVWKPGTIMKNAAQRMLTLLQLQPLFNQSNCQWFNLQKEPDADKTSLVSSGKLIDWSDEFGSFDDTAALISHLDLVISVDTAVAHLAGALGRPVWMFNRHASEWRWMRDREDSAWYPTMRIFTQKIPGEWDEVVARMATVLAAL